MISENKEKRVYTVKRPEKMQKLGKKLAKQLSGGDVILLSGELGAGKTVFCKGLAAGLKIKSPVVSPTFTIMNEYDGDIKFCHFDAYRLENADEAVGAGLADFIGNDECICAVEWWRNIEELFAGCRTTHVTIEKKDERTREVTIQ